MDIQAIIIDYGKLKDKFLLKKGEYLNLLTTGKTLLTLRDQKTSTLEIMEKAKLLLAESSKYAKEKVKTQIETLVTNGLQYIFGDNRRFEIEISEGKSRTEAEFYVVSEVGGVEIKTRPQNSRGGGVVDVICLILRVAMLQTYSPTPQGPLILDEPVKMVSSEYIDKVGEFLQQLNEYFGRQVVMATHNGFLAEIGDEQLLVTQTNGISHVEITS